LPQYDGCALCVDRDWPAIEMRRDTNPATGTTPESLCYVIYTSGSTGEPKGVAARHCGVMRLVCNPNYAVLSPATTIAHLSNVAFDAATFEIWGALLNGGRLVVLANDVVLAPESLAAALAGHGVTCLFLTTALFNRMSVARPGAFRRIGQVLFGGETCDPERVRAVLEAGPPGQLTHVYGPTETTTFATFHPAHEVRQNDRTIPIGRPISGTRVYILDGQGEPAPIGVAGEIHIGGPGVAAGYLNRAVETGARFIADPFHAGAGERLYCTGDLARYLPDGSIEFLGRTDDQVKLRGFRIEPGEIQVALNAHAAVRESYVALQPQLSGEPGLTAYYVVENGLAIPPGTKPSVAELRQYLAARLPPHVIPSSFVELPSIPLTPNGKVDRSTLPSPLMAPRYATGSPEPPRDAVERDLCRIWSDVLGIEQIGIDDNFFELGGHSLLGASLFARLDRAMSRALPLATLFEAPTVRGLARLYREGAEPASLSALVPITSSGSLPPVFAVPGVNGNVLGLAELARELGPMQPFYGLQSIGLDGRQEPLERLEQIAALYVREMRQVRSRGPYHLIGACFGATVAYEVARQLLEAGEEVAFLGLMDPSSLGGDAPDQAGRYIPASLKRGLALGRFVTDRLRLYRDQMRGLALRDRMRFIRSKIQVVGEITRKRDVFRDARREFNQRRIYDANVAALLRYRHEPLKGGRIAFEIFGTESRYMALASSSRVDWLSLSRGAATYHPVPGKDSGDMLRGNNARQLAVLLRERLERANRN
jgi:amino acid adenylation domain-containing protein